MQKNRGRGRGVGVLNRPESRECCECTNEDTLTVPVEDGTLSKHSVLYLSMHSFGY